MLIVKLAITVSALGLLDYALGQSRCAVWTIGVMSVAAGVWVAALTL
jgi:hypothetical protein